MAQTRVWQLEGAVGPFLLNSIDGIPLKRSTGLESLGRRTLTCSNLVRLASRDTIKLLMNGHLQQASCQAPLASQQMTHRRVQEGVPCRESGGVDGVFRTAGA